MDFRQLTLERLQKFVAQRYFVTKDYLDGAVIPVTTLLVHMLHWSMCATACTFILTLSFLFNMINSGKRALCDQLQTLKSSRQA